MTVTGPDNHHWTLKVMNLGWEEWSDPGCGGEVNWERCNGWPNPLRQHIQNGSHTCTAGYILVWLFIAFPECDMGSLKIIFQPTFQFLPTYFYLQKWAIGNDEGRGLLPSIKALTIPEVTDLLQVCQGIILMAFFCLEARRQWQQNKLE